MTTDADHSQDEISTRVYLEEGDLIDLDIPNGWVVYRNDDGSIVMEQDDSGGSPGSWPIEDS
ncbi:MAG TPA: hypothetical protein VMU95_19345 [Trebonia sp.]|nr:hypothetical protein [Trebonia sp.]